MFGRRRSRPGRVERRVTAEIISLIREMATKNRLWGAERIRGEFLKLGIKLSKRTVQKYMRRVREHRGGGQTPTSMCEADASRSWVLDGEKPAAFDQRRLIRSPTVEAPGVEPVR